MDTRLIRTPALYLVGFMGSGKTTIGAALADELGWRFFDLDDDIEAAAGSKIVDIFERDGEAGFRRREHQALDRRVSSAKHGMPMIVALGGGTFAQENNVDLGEGQRRDDMARCAV
jgi:shikimate kinase